MSTINHKLDKLPPGTFLTEHDPIQSRNFGDIPREKFADRRFIAEEETRRDLNKSYEQLLADAHHETTDDSEGRTPLINFAFASRRIAGISARAALAAEESAIESSKAASENIKLQKEVRDLTVDLKLLTDKLKTFTIILLILAAIQTFYPIIKPFFDAPKPAPAPEQSGDTR